MDRMLYVAMTGAKELMNLQNTHMNNLANVNTTGFKAELEHLKDYTVKGNELNSRAYVQSEATQTNVQSGALRKTDNPLDVAVEGEGYFAVRDVDGKEYYTRSGHWKLDETGQLVTSVGQPVMGAGGPITLPPHSQLSIAKDGTISVIPAGQKNFVPVNQLKLVKIDPQNIMRMPSGLFKDRSTEVAVADPNIRVASGFLENSNVNAVESLIGILSATRNFEMNMKMMKSAEDNDHASSQLISL